MSQTSVNQIGLAEPLVIAVDNGGTNTRVEGRVGNDMVGNIDYPTPESYEVAIETLAKAAYMVAPDKKIEAVGFSIAGKLDEDATHIKSAGALASYGWVGKPFKADIAAAVGIEEDGVILLNDCVAAAKAQQVANRQQGNDQPGFIETISTGFGGAGFTTDTLVADEPGHEFYKAGVKCGCGKDGCAEAHISGSGIESKYLIRAEDLPAEQWEKVIADAVEVHVAMLNRLSEQGLTPHSLHLFGSVALKSPMFRGLQEGLPAKRDQLTYLPEVVEATYGEASGLQGASEAALELLSA